MWVPSSPPWLLCGYHPVRPGYVGPALGLCRYHPVRPELSETPPRLRRGYSVASRGDTATATWLVRGRVAATPRLRLGYSATTRGAAAVDIPWRLAAPPLLQRRQHGSSARHVIARRRHLGPKKHPRRAAASPQPGLITAQRRRRGVAATRFGSPRRCATVGLPPSGPGGLDETHASHAAHWAVKRRRAAPPLSRRPWSSSLKPPDVPPTKTAARCFRGASSDRYEHRAGCASTAALVSAATYGTGRWPAKARWYLRRRGRPDPSPRNRHVVAAASPRPCLRGIATSSPRRRRDPVSTEPPRRRRDGAATASPRNR